MMCVPRELDPSPSVRKSSHLLLSPDAFAAGLFRRHRDETTFHVFDRNGYLVLFWGKTESIRISDEVFVLCCG